MIVRFRSATINVYTVKVVVRFPAPIDLVHTHIYIYLYKVTSCSSYGTICVPTVRHLMYMHLNVTYGHDLNARVHFQRQGHTDRIIQSICIYRFLVFAEL